MSWRREWLLTNSTCFPGGTVSSFGLTMPPLEMVMANGFEGLGEGVAGESPPHAPHAIKQRMPHVRPDLVPVIGAILTGEPENRRRRNRFAVHLIVIVPLRLALLGSL